MVLRKTEYSNAVNARYTFQLVVGFCVSPINPPRASIQCLVSCHPVLLSTSTGRAEKLDEVQFSIPAR